MNLHSPYYHLKPYLPWRLRMAMRRWIAKRRLASCERVWPIKQGTETPPEGWPGWPEGKQFAVVLTHDVEGPTGLARVPQLMELEKRFGFRSSFNFIPEGAYRVSKDLRNQLVSEGFEVGVHDLYHDGKLYASKEAFRAHAHKINYYLKEWKAAGFRSGFMHHNLDWLHDLNIQHDASTFDTDPFEPQPDGANTIFPFWVPAPPSPLTGSPRPSDGRGIKGEGVWGEGRGEVPPSSGPSTINPGYVELPYTLPQDSTLFLVFRERTDALWRKKLDWVAKHGGMVLLDTHPDYLCFNGHILRDREYSSETYASFLQYLRTQYGGDFWPALPHEVANRLQPVTTAH